MELGGIFLGSGSFSKNAWRKFGKIYNDPVDAFSRFRNRATGIKVFRIMPVLLSCHPEMGRDE
jgi:hypothetical protein